MGSAHSHRSRGAAMAVALMFALTGGVPSAHAQSGPTSVESLWTQGGNGYHRSGMNPAETDLDASSVGGVQQLGAVPRMGSGTPVVLNGAVYVSRNFRGPTRFGKYALDDLSPVWARDVFEESETPVADGAYDQGLFVTVTRSQISATNLEGARVWKHSLPTNPAPAAPTVKDGVAYIVDATGLLTALDIKNGETLWSVPFASAPGVPTAVGPVVIYGYNVLVARTGLGGGESGVTSLDPITGAYRWTINVGPLASPRLLVRRGLAVVSGENGLSVLRAHDGSSVWTLDPGRLGCRIGSIGVPAVARRSLFVPHNCDQGGRLVGGLAKIDLESGNPAWRRSYDRSIAGIATAASNFVVVNTGTDGTADIMVHAMSDGRVLRELDVGDTPAGPVAIAQGRLFANSGEWLVVFGLPPTGP